jgi:hypothetical protein
LLWFPAWVEPQCAECAPQCMGVCCFAGCMWLASACGLHSVNAGGQQCTARPCAGPKYCTNTRCTYQCWQVCCSAGSSFWDRDCVAVGVLCSIYSVVAPAWPKGPCALRPTAA